VQQNIKGREGGNRAGVVSPHYAKAAARRPRVMLAMPSPSRLATGTSPERDPFGPTAEVPVEVEVEGRGTGRAGVLMGPGPPSTPSGCSCCCSPPSHPSSSSARSHSSSSSRSLGSTLLFALTLPVEEGHNMRWGREGERRARCPKAHPHPGHPVAPPLNTGHARTHTHTHAHTLIPLQTHATVWSTP
jgi:hypothetical protein